MRIRDFMAMVVATIGNSAPPSQQAVARGFAFGYTSPFADAAFRSLAEAAFVDENLFVCRSTSDPRRFLDTAEREFVPMTTPRASIMVLTEADQFPMSDGEWVTVAEALEAAGNDLQKYARPSDI